MRQIKKIPALLILLLISLFLSSFAQAQSKGYISGNIVDANTGEPLLFANILLMNAKDSSHIAGTSSDTEGKFSFKDLRFGDYLIKASVISYHPYTSHKIELSRVENQLDNFKIAMQASSTELKEVVIEGRKKPLIEQMAGKMIFNVAASPTRQSDNAYELLKKFPGVKIDMEDNISYNGKSGILVTIDDKNPYLSGTDLANMLKGMPASEIEKIEASENPSSRYDAEGVAGIINIKTTRNRTMGFSGSVRAGASVQKGFRHNEGASINYRNNNITLYGDISAHGNNSKSGSYSKTSFPDRTQRSTNLLDAEKWASNSKYNGIYGKAGIDYYIGKKDIISLSYRGTYRDGRNSGNTFTRTQDSNDIFLNSYKENSEIAWAGGNHNVSLNYQHIFDTALTKEIFVDANYINNSELSGVNSNTDYFSGDFDELYLNDKFTVKTPIYSNIFSIKVDYSHRFNKNTKMETGVKGSYNNIDNFAAYYLEDGSEDNRRSNRYLYKELIGAAYLIANHSFSPNTSIEVGLRGEYTSFNGKSVNIDSSNNNAYFRLFPSFNFSQKLGKSNLNVSYRYRLSRPRYTHLNPFLLQVSPSVFQSGNPLLRPEYSHIVSLGYSYNYFFFINATYVHSDGSIHKLDYYDEDYIMYRRPENIGQSNSLSLNLSIQKTFFKIWNFTAYVYGAYSSTQINYKDKIEKTPNFTASLWLSNEVNILPDLIAEISGWYAPSQRYLFSDSKGMGSLNLGIKKTFLKKTLSLSLSVNDILNTGSSYNYETKLPDGTFNSGKSYWSSRSVSLNLNYRFGKGNVKLRQKRSAAEEESGRLGGQEGGNK